MDNRQKIIIDMDIGDDIDDAFALLLAMKLNFNIIGITTVFQNTVQRARIAKKMLKLFGNGYENVPVYSGYKTPMAEKAEQYPTLRQYTDDIEADIYKPDSENCDDAIDFIIDSCNRYKDELTVIAIGPFTNIAMAAKKDSAALNSAKELVIMGGAYYKQYADWNVICDVEAADIMFKNVNNIKCIGADVTHRLNLSDEDAYLIKNYNGNDKTLEYVSELYRLWRKTCSINGFLHDPLVIYYIFDNKICECEDASVAVLTDGFARGITLNVNSYKKSHMNKAYSEFDFAKTHSLAKEVDREKMINAFMEIFRKN